MNENNSVRNVVYIGRFATNTLRGEVRGFLRNFRNIKDLKLCTGFAFVEFYDWRDAEAAIRELDGGYLNGGDVKVSLAHGLPRNRNHNVTRPAEPLYDRSQADRRGRHHRRSRLSRATDSAERNQRTANNDAAEQRNDSPDRRRYGEWLETPLHSFLEREIPRRFELDGSNRNENDRYPFGLSYGNLDSEEHWKTVMQNAQLTVDRCQSKLRMIALRKRLADSMSGGNDGLNNV